MLTILQRHTTMIAIFDPMFCKVDTLEKQGQRYGRSEQCRTGNGQLDVCESASFEVGALEHQWACSYQRPLLCSGPRNQSSLLSRRDELGFSSYLLETDLRAG